MFFSIILFVFICFLLFSYLIELRNARYWKKRGVVFHNHNRFFGMFWEYLTKNRSLFEILSDIYKKYPDEAAVGLGSWLVPSVYIKDYKNVQHIMQNDFNAFNHRGLDVVTDDVLADNLLFMTGARWKLMRQNMSPLFTPAKLKSMYYIIDKSAQDFVKLLKDNPHKLKGDAYETLNSFCSAAIGAAVFGITPESVFDSPFLEMSKKAVKPTLSLNLKFSLALVAPKLCKALGIKVFSEFENFFVGAIDQVIKKRKEEGGVAHDFADLCVNLQKNDVLKDDAMGMEIKPTTGILAAQAFFFFIAGVEPAATAMFSALIELGRNPEVLKKVHDELDETFSKHGSKMTHDIIADMEYLDKVLSESMRMYPPIGFSVRVCNADSILPVGNLKIEAGSKVYTPIYDIHFDEKYFPNPKVFNPERFTRDGLQASLSDMPYMPFGKGNRICIGARYARMQVKAGLAYILRNFSVTTIEGKGGMKFAKAPLAVRPTNVDVQFIPRF